ncbi:MAG TPA: threonine synthase [Niabella sp.]|nr:threonine synthase [Niabella sp.]HOZ96841.1 threonine synthase [Niabella sp.]HQW15049.1 threonine synthase [Niabella sp.]HQX20190.1 threonine synthase [Niabella sp.]HQX42697.1 threonine synthase [Niabella sp.]
MNYYSLNSQSPVVNFKEATIQGQAPDKGLYFPEKLPVFDSNLIQNIENISDVDIAFEVMKPYVVGSIPDEELRRIVAETISFSIPLVSIKEDIASLELFHGPTLAFKDVGARFMSRCLSYFLKNGKREVTVLVATSGDTGGAVANGFYGVENVNVVILYPKGRVSPVQEKQLTTLGKNITALEVEGSFDDCQRMVKQAFVDKEINEKKFLTSANSINVARWLPQQIYYFLAYKQWKQKNIAPVVCVPSGNFGNICAGMLAKVTGLPLGHFIAACNVNDIVSQYLQTQELIPKETTATLSNAMDVGNPSNFVRIIELFHQHFPELKNNLSADTITDADTLATIKNVYNQFDYTLDPHGAVAYLALEKYLSSHPLHKGFILETAHPVKFPYAVENATEKEVDIPEVLKEMMTLEKESILLSPDFESLKSYLLSE